MTTTGPGRPRRPDTDARIRTAAVELIREHGPDAVTIVSVATRSGVARTTIYRRYADRTALLAAALLPVAEQEPPPSTLDVTGRLEWVLATTATVLDEHVGPGGVATVFSDRDPEFSAALREALADGLRPVAEQITADLADGALTADVTPDVVVNLIVGSHLAEALRHGTPSQEWRTRTAASLATLLGATP